MSRPPIHRPAPSPRGSAVAGAPRRYFGPDFAALVALAETVARDNHGIEIPAKGRGLARTLIELPALLAHILGEHQSLYAREAFLGSAELTDNLVHHARKLAYSPDPGVAATGLAAFTVKAGLSGTLAKSFALQSSPLGEAKAETYETLAETAIEAGWNSIRPAAARIPNPMLAAGGRLQLELVARHGLEEGEIVLLVGPNDRVGVFRVDDAHEGAKPPAIGLSRLGGDAFTMTATAANWAGAGFRILARPKIEARLFGWNAQGAVWPPTSLAAPGAYAAPIPASAVGAVTHGYEAPPSANSMLLLSETVVPPPAASYVAVTSAAASTPYALGQAGEAVVSFVRGEMTEQPVVSTSVVNGNTVVSVTNVKRVVEARLSARATTLALQVLPARTPRTWPGFPLDSRILAEWSEEIALVSTVTNQTAIQPEFTVTADLQAMRPGRPAILRRISTGEVREASFAAIKTPETAGGLWTIRLDVPGGFPANWPIGDIEVLGNVIRVSHGEAKSEILGSSNGVSPHQEFKLKKAPVTRTPGALGAEIALEVRVDGVLWDLAEDFHGQGAEARVYVEETQADGSVTVVFGGERRGAIPPSGKRNVTADYREGLGTKGNAGSGRVSRIKKSSPFVESVTNPLAITGGADAAGAIDIARQAVRPVKVFDRAVSIDDYADLALLFPSIVRASARWLDTGGIELVAADGEGNGPADLAAFAAFLDARRDTGLSLSVVAPEAVEVTLTLRVERDRAWLADAVRLSVEEALLGGPSGPGLFTFAGRELSAPQALSGLYALLLSLPGVAGVEATQFRLAAQRVGGGNTQVFDIIHASERQWLLLSPSSLDIQMVEPGLLDRALTGGGGIA